jgi:hypothetical protein
LLEQLRTKPATFSEHVVVRLLVRMGYGGSFDDAGKAIGRSGDGGIDGVIMQDRLGLDNVYVPANRFAAERAVGADVVRSLAGALIVRKATMVVLITTSTFAREAVRTADQTGSVSLVDGEQLAHLMIEFDLGVGATARYQVKKIDQDFFDDWSLGAEMWDNGAPRCCGIFGVSSSVEPSPATGAERVEFCTVRGLGYILLATHNRLVVGSNPIGPTIGSGSACRTRLSAVQAWAEDPRGRATIPS